MELSEFKSLSFGITSAVITTLGMLVGMNSGTGSKTVIIGGIAMLALADSFSDAVSSHFSEESSKKESRIKRFKHSLSMFLSKALFSITFIVPFLFFSIPTAVFIDLFWGMSILVVDCYFVGKRQKSTHLVVFILFHLLFASMIVLFSHLLGVWIGEYFGGL